MDIKNNLKNLSLDLYSREENSGFFYKKNISFNDESYVLNGMGTRYKLLFVIYSIAIYLPNYCSLKQIKNNEFGSKMLLLLKCFREINILTITSGLNQSIQLRIPENLQDNIKDNIKKNILHLEWIIKKAIESNLEQHDELYLEIVPKKSIGIYLGKNIKEITNSYFIEKIKDNLVPSNEFKKIGNVMDEYLPEILIQCYIDINSVTPNMKHSINHIYSIQNRRNESGENNSIALD